jgi:hypothetical protein
MLYLIHRCQAFRRAGDVRLGNLIHSFRRVQQLFVRVIFLPGISGSAKWTRNLERPRADRFVEAERSLQTRRIKQTTTVSSTSSAGTWALICGETDDRPATTTAPQGRLTRRLPCAGSRVEFADQAPSEENSLSDSIGPSSATYLVATPCSSVIPPRNNRVTRSCWTW